MPVNMGAIRDLTTPGLRGIEGKYDMIPVQYKDVFKKETSKMAVERTAEMRFLPLAQLKAEGAATAFDTQAGERAIYNQEHIEVALGYAVTQKAVEDNLYARMFPLSNLQLAASFQQTKEIQAASVFNTASTWNPAIGGDGVALCARNHPIDQGVWANRPVVDVDLGESTLLAGQTSIRTNFVDQAGLKVMARARKLVIPPQLEPVANRLLKSELRPGTSDNDVNAIRYTAGGLPGGYVVLDFLTSPFAWFLLTDKDGLLWMQRRAFEMDSHVDFATNNLLVKGTERYSFGYYNPRCIWGSFPTS